MTIHYKKKILEKSYEARQELIHLLAKLLLCNMQHLNTYWYDCNQLLAVVSYADLV